VSIIGSGDEAETKDLKSVESKDAAAESLAAHKERITRGHLDTVSKVDPNWAQVRVISEVSMSGKLKVKTGRYPVAVGTGYVDGYSEETNRKQIIVVVTDGCKVLCYTSELQLMWEQNLHCDLLENYVSEVSIFVTSHSIMKGDRGMVIVGARLYPKEHSSKHHRHGTTLDDDIDEEDDDDDDDDDDASEDDGVIPARRPAKRLRDVLKGFHFLLTKVDAKVAADLITSMGGKVAESVEEAHRLSIKGCDVLVIADRPRTTKKYMFSLARGLSPLKLGFLQECRRQRMLVDPSPFTIPFGVPLDQTKAVPLPSRWNSLVERNFLQPLAQRKRVLSGRTFAVSSVSPKASRQLKAIIQEAGAKVVVLEPSSSSSSSKQASPDDYYCVICNNADDAAKGSSSSSSSKRKRTERVVFAWVVECLQTQKLVGFQTAHYDFTLIA